MGTAVTSGRAVHTVWQRRAFRVALAVLALLAVLLLDLCLHSGVSGPERERPVGSDASRVTVVDPGGARGSAVRGAAVSDPGP